MTSDAKVGLLLGLVFIVIIAFLINGLPGLISKGSSSMAVDTSVPAYSGNLGLTEKAGDAISRVSEFDPLKIQKRNSLINKDSRFKDDVTVAKRYEKKSSDKKTLISSKKFYTVQNGDSLGRIAIKVYGREIGNKQATVDLIFQANSNILTSPDDISIDQKLVMPSLGADAVQPAKRGSVAVRQSGTSQEEELMETGEFEKIGRAFKNIFSKQKRKSSSLSVYVVKDGDSLWEIASRKLGNGLRYREIIKLNNSILKGADDLAPDMMLKMPHK